MPNYTIVRVQDDIINRMMWLLNRRHRAAMQRAPFTPSELERMILTDRQRMLAAQLEETGFESFTRSIHVSVKFADILSTGVGVRLITHDPASAVLSPITEHFSSAGSYRSFCASAHATAILHDDDTLRARLAPWLHELVLVTRRWSFIDEHIPRIIRATTCTGDLRRIWPDLVRYIGGTNNGFDPSIQAKFRNTGSSIKRTNLHPSMLGVETSNTIKALNAILAEALMLPPDDAVTTAAARSGWAVASVVFDDVRTSLPEG